MDKHDNFGEPQVKFIFLHFLSTDQPAYLYEKEISSECLTPELQDYREMIKFFVWSQHSCCCGLEIAMILNMVSEVSF